MPLNHNTIFEVTDKHDVVFLTDDNNDTSDTHSNMLTTPLQRLNWKVSVSPLPIHQKPYTSGLQ